MTGEVKDMLFTALLTSLMMFACGAPRAGFTTETAQRDDFKERDEITRRTPMVSV